MNRRMAATCKTIGMINGTTFSRTHLAILPSLVTAVNARSVVATRRRAKAMRSGS